MNKLYLAFLLLICVFSVGVTYGQLPSIGYSGTKNLTVNQKITPIVPSNTGGAIPNELYSKANTIAGDGFYGYKDTLAKFARFASPINSAIDKNGNIFITDANLNTIRKISANGVVSTFAGNPFDTTIKARNGQDTAARFRYPTGVACDSKGNVYVADFGNNMIRKITPTGLVSTLAGSTNFGDKDGMGTTAQFNLPYALTVDKNDDIIVADTYNNKIRMITPEGNVTTFAGTGAPGFNNAFIAFATFRIPYSVVIGPSGKIYVADRGNSCIRVIDKGRVTTFSDTLFKKTISVASDDQERIYVTTEDDYNIVQIDSKGNRVGSIPFSGGSYRASVNSSDTLSSYKGSMGLLYDGKDNLIVTEPFGSLVRKVAVHGWAISPRLPQGLSIDGTGTISGTPEVISPLTAYRITAYNSSGSNTAGFNLSVGIGSQTITFNKPDDVTYGTADFPLKATSTNTGIAIKYTSSNLDVATIVSDTIHVVSAGTTTITATQAGNVNYTAAAPVAQTLVVKKAPLTITAQNVIKTVGTDNPGLPVSYSGFVNSQDTTIITKKPVTTTTAVKLSPVGDYPVTVSGAEAKNYLFVYVPGKLTVFPIPVVTAIGSTSIVKGGSVRLKVSPSTGYAYQWTFNGIPIAGATDTIYAATQTGAYNVSITANNYTTYSLYTSVLAQVKLTADNFKIQLNSVTCKGSNNGSIFISATQKLKYTAVITGNSLNNPIPFTDTLTIRNLSPGNYSVCFSIEGEIYSQCNQVNISEPRDLSVYSTINKTLNNINLQLDGGRNFNIMLNNVEYKTTEKQITLPLLAGSNKLTVTTDNLCRGVIEKTIVLNDKLVPYPNPFNNILYVNVGNDNVRNVGVNIVGLTDGKTGFTNQYVNKSGILELDLSTLSNGMYFLNLNLDNRKSGFKIIKK